MDDVDAATGAGDGADVAGVEAELEETSASRFFFFFLSFLLLHYAALQLHPWMNSSYSGTRPH